MTLTWHQTSLPAARSRTDDVFFHDESRGWAVNSDGKVYRTVDGADNWDQQHLFPDSQRVRRHLSLPYADRK